MPEIRRSFVYKLDPTPTQIAVLERTKGLCNWLYNTALHQRIDAWKYGKRSVTHALQEAELPDLKTAFPEFKGVHSLVLQHVLERLDLAYQAFFRRVKAGETPGHPRFKASTRYHSFTYKQYGNGATFDNGFLVLSKIGRIKVRWSRPLAGTPKTITVSKKADGWYVSVSCQAVPTVALPPTGRETGIDMGLDSFLTTSEGEQIANPRYFRQAEDYLAKCQRRVSRCKKGSKGWKQQVTLLGKAHQKVARQRRDHHFKTANALVQTYDVMVHEALVIRNMVKHRHMAKSISDAGWGQFLAILAYKAACAGRQVLAVPPHYTSQDCSGCGARVQKSLSVRTHRCSACGLMLDRDANAARNIQRAGLVLRGLAGIPAGQGVFGRRNRESPAF